MANIQHADNTDIQQQQFECVLNIFQERAHQLTNVWPVMLKTMGSATNRQKDDIP